MSDESDRQVAEDRVDAKVEFFGHLGVFIVVMSVLTYISLGSHPRHYWFLWVLGGWGIGVVRNGMHVYRHERPWFRRLASRSNHG